MDFGGQSGGGRHRFDNFRENHSESSWMTANQHQAKQQNALNLNKTFMSLLAERDAAIEERNRALSERKKALEEREEAILQRNQAIKERNDAMLERDNANSALQHSMNQPTGLGVQGGMKWSSCNLGNHTHGTDSPYVSSEMQILDALCKTVSGAECKSPQAKRKKNPKTHTAKPRRMKLMGEDLNRQIPPDVLKLRNDCDSQNSGINRVDFDECTMPFPGCSCTGVFRQCYKWGNGGWQSSCCTTAMSVYPLPPVPNKRYTRRGGRKMSGSAFSKLLTRLASEGYEFSIPVDLKDFWSKHGTNRYITIK